MRAEAMEFLHTYGRLVERRMAASLFEGEPAAGAVAAILAYQNADGGFGHGLEPDKRTPTSQPVDAQIALEYLELLGQVQGPWLEPLLAGLAALATPAGALPFATPAVMRHPRSPWWNVEPDPPPSLNPTGAIAGVLLGHGVTHPWLERAAAWCWPAVETLESVWYHDVLNAVAFLRGAGQPERAAPLLERLRTAVLASDGIAFDADAGGYVKGPLDWAPTPDHPLRAMFSDEQLTAALAALKARQQPDGGWPITWEPISPAVLYECRGMATLQALLTLRAYGEL